MALERNDLSRDSIKVNGTYLEDIITGFQILSSTGRETLSKEINNLTFRRDGSIHDYSRFPERTITVNYVIDGDSPEAFRNNCTALNKHLNVDDVKIQFNDEVDKYYIGSITVDDPSEKYGIVYNGSFKIICKDPFKYSTTETGPISMEAAYDTSDVDAYDESISYVEGDMVTHLDGTINKLYECIAATTGTWDSSKWTAVTNMAFTVNNTGGYKTYPRFVVDFAEDVTDGVVGTDGNSGFIQFAKVEDNETIRRIQFGDDEAELPVIGDGFDVDFTKNTLGGFSNASGTTISDFTDAANASASTLGVKPAYGSGSGWHGSLITKNASAAADFKLDFTQLVYLTNKKQMFGFMAVCLDSSNNIVAGVKYTKSNKTNTKGTISYIISGTQKKSITQDFKRAGSYGYTKASGGKVRNGNSYIKRSGSTITMKLAGDSKASYFYPSSITTVSKIGFFFVKKGTNTNPAGNYLRSAKFTASSTENVFNSGCKLEVDCNDASVLLDTVPSPTIGDVGNEWSDFYLDVGNNVIFVGWSDWTVDAPSVRMYYRKRWL